MLYSIVRSCIQFVLPLVIVFGVYASIYLRIKYRPAIQNGLQAAARQNCSGSSPTNGQIQTINIQLQEDQLTTGTALNNGTEYNDIFNRRLAVRESRKRRANVMIISIAVVFFLSWLPLNSINLALEFSPDLFGGDNGTDAHSRDIHNLGRYQGGSSYNVFKFFIEYGNI